MTENQYELEAGNVRLRINAVLKENRYLTTASVSIVGSKIGVSTAKGVNVDIDAIAPHKPVKYSIQLVGAYSRLSFSSLISILRFSLRTTLDHAFISLQFQFQLRILLQQIELLSVQFADKLCLLGKAVFLILQLFLQEISSIT